MLTPSWDPVIGTLGGVLDPKVVISRLNTEWSRRQGLTMNSSDPNMVYQTGARSGLKCENCNRSGHTKARCWEKGGGQEGQYPEWFKGKRDTRTSNTVKAVTDSHIIWTYGAKGHPDVWYADSAATVHVSPNHGDFISYHRYDKQHVIKTFGNNLVEAVGEGDILTDVQYKGKPTRI